MIRKLILLFCFAALPSVALAANKQPPGCKVSSGVTECQVTVDSVGRHAIDIAAQHCATVVRQHDGDEVARAVEIRNDPAG